VLVKANKLYPHELSLLLERFEQARRAGEVSMLKAKLAALQEHGPERGAAQVEEIEARWQKERFELDSMLDFILTCNRPTILEKGGFERLKEMSRVVFEDSEGNQRQVLTEADTINLAIPRGSLNPEEREEIESHVVHTYNFLKKIPWTGDLKNVPEFAKGHHEKLDGSGYPHSRPALEIPVQTRVMTIADIYDALTASDRPYKSAMPHERALGILESEAKQGKLDYPLLEIFIEAKFSQASLASE
jgi:hypothetical protein